MYNSMIHKDALLSGQMIEALNQLNSMFLSSSNSTINLWTGVDNNNVLWLYVGYYTEGLGFIWDSRSESWEKYSYTKVLNIVRTMQEEKCP